MSSQSSASSESSSSVSSQALGGFSFYALDINGATIVVNVVGGSISGTFDFYVLTDDGLGNTFVVSVVGGVVTGTFGFYAMNTTGDTIHITVTNGVVTLE